MQPVNEALDEVKELYRKILGAPAPEILPASFVSFPPGVDPLHHALQEVEELKKLSERMAFAPAPTAWIPRADSFIMGNDFVIRLEVPEFKREELKVFVAGSECIVRGERQPLEVTPDIRPLNVERPRGPFERRFLLPIRCKTEKLTARCADGILELRVELEGNGAPKETKVEVK